MEKEETNKIIEYAEPTYKLKLITGDEIHINTNNVCRVVVTNINYETVTLHAFLIIGHIVVDIATIDFDKTDMPIRIALSEVLEDVSKNPERYKNDIYKSIIDVNSIHIDDSRDFKIPTYKQAYVMAGVKN